MISLTLSSTLRENHQEILQRWLSNVHSNVAEDFENVLRTPMGRAVAQNLLGYAIEVLGAEEYERPDILRAAWDSARDASFRRAAVGFSLPDIIATAMALRLALQQTLLNHVMPGEVEEQVMLDALLAIDELGDTIVSGEIAGYLSFQDSWDMEGEEGIDLY